MTFSSKYALTYPIFKDFNILSTIDKLFVQQISIAMCIINNEMYLSVLNDLLQNNDVHAHNTRTKDNYVPYFTWNSTFF